MKYYTHVLIKVCLIVCIQGFSFQFAQQTSDLMQHDDPEIVLSGIVNNLPSLQQDFTQLIDHGVDVPSLYDYMYAKLIDVIDDENDVFAEKLHEAICSARNLITISLLSEGFNLLKENKIQRCAKEFPTFSEYVAEQYKNFENVSLEQQDDYLKRATTFMGMFMKKIFINEFNTALSSRQNIQDIQDPIFQYVLRNSSGLMKSRCLLWVNKLSHIMISPCLVVAAGTHNMSAVKFLVELGVDINESFNPYKRTALYNAVLYNSPEIVAFLIDQGADVNMVDFKGSSPLMAAVFHNYQDIAQKLIDAGADCFAQNVDGLTPLSIAHTKNYKQLEALLLSQELLEHIA